MNTEQFKELAYTNRWLITNRWGDPERREDALRTADRLVELATGQASEPVVQPEPAPTPLVPPFRGQFIPPAWKHPDHFPIVGVRFTSAEFARYVQWVQENEEYTWAPTGITMHHTAWPDLSIRPDGFTTQHMENIRSGYINDNGWNRGPHIFTDQNGIWVFNPLSLRGIHAVSFNHTRYGIEMLGNFDGSDFDDPRGQASLRNGQIAAAILMKHAGISTGKLNFHRHDPETNKTCPGRKVDFATFEEGVLAIEGSLL